MDKNSQQLNEQAGWLWHIIQQWLKSGMTWEEIWENIKPYLAPETLKPHEGDTPDPDLYKTVAKEERMLDQDWNSLVESAAQVGSRGLNEQFGPPKRKEKPVMKYPALTDPSVGKESQLVDVEAEATEIIKMMLQQQQRQNQNRMYEASNTVNPQRGAAGSRAYNAKTKKSNIGLDISDVMSKGIHNNNDRSSQESMLIEVIRWIIRQFMGPLK